MNLVKDFPLFCALLLIAVVPVWGDENDLFGDERTRPQEKVGMDSPLRMSFSGALDTRFAAIDEASSWQSGGRGLTRSGASRDGQKEYRLLLASASLVNESFYKNQLGSHIQVHYTDHADDAGKLGIVEAYLMKGGSLGKRSWKWKARAGILIPPVSLEHPNTAWNTQWSITPSAINSWVGEELRPVAAEFQVTRDELSFMAAAFSGNDPLGSLLAWRGWAMHDQQALYGSRWRVQQNPVSTTIGSNWTHPFKEVDGRVGGYGQVRYENENGELSFFYLNNLANGTAFDGADYGWPTDFWNASLKLNFINDWNLMAQFLSGETGMGPGKRTVRNKIGSWYVLLSHRPWDRHRLTFRFDAFEVEDKDGWRQPVTNLEDKNDMEGKAFTLAYLYQWDDLTTVGVEYLSLNSERVGNVPYPDTDPKDNLLQVMVRVLF